MDVFTSHVSSVRVSMTCDSVTVTAKTYPFFSA